MVTSANKKPGPKKGTKREVARPLDAEFPARLKLAMAEHKPPLTHAGLARLVGCSRMVIGNYVSGNQKTADPLLLLAIADALKVRLSWLLAKSGAMREPNGMPLSPEARQIAINIDAIQDPARRDQALKIARLATEPTAPAEKEKAYKTAERPRVAGQITRPTLFDDDMEGPR